MGNLEAMTELQEVEIQRVSGHYKKITPDLVVFEDEILFILNGRSYRSFCCLPTHLEEMARGYLVSEGVCRPSGIKSIEVRLDGGKFVVEAIVHRHGTKLSKINSEMKISIADVCEAVERLNEHSILFKKTGGAHVAEIFSRGNSLFAEDVSRHCAIDKAIGLALQNGVDLTTGMLVTSCRQTGSTIKKAIRSQIPIVITTSAVTSLAIERARKYGITLIGFARGDRFNIYSHRERVVDNEQSEYEPTGNINCPGWR